MAFTVDDFNDFVRLLQQHPEWQERLRRLLLRDELANLAESVQGLRTGVEGLLKAQKDTEKHLAELARRVEALAEAQQRAEERLSRLEAAVAELAERQRQTEERLEALTARVDALAARMDELTARVDALAARMDELTARVDALAEAQQRTEAHLAQLASEVRRLDGTVGSLKGQVLAMAFRDRAYAYLGRRVRRLQVLSAQRLAWLLEDAVEAGRLSEVERDRLALVDLVAAGKDKETGEEVYLAVEVSVTVDQADVARAVERASLLGKAVAGRAVPVVAGERITEGAHYQAQDRGVVRVLDGHVEWP